MTDVELTAIILEYVETSIACEDMRVSSYIIRQLANEPAGFNPRNGFIIDMLEHIFPENDLLFNCENGTTVKILLRQALRLVDWTEIYIETEALLKGAGQ